jgi:hypothetical protein
VPDSNRALFESVVRLLGPVLDDLVFVGGCTTGLFLTDSVAGGIRPTKDVDAIVDVTTYAGAGTVISSRVTTSRTLSPSSTAAPDGTARIAGCRCPPFRREVRADMPVPRAARPFRNDRKHRRGGIVA